MKKIIIIILILVIVILGIIYIPKIITSRPGYWEVHSTNSKYYPNNQDYNISRTKSATSNESTMKIYMSDKFSFSYNSNSEIKEIKNKDNSLFAVHVAEMGEKNTEKGIYIYFYVKGAQGSNFAEPCNKPTEIEGKMFCVIPANNGSDSTDGVYGYTKGNYQVQIAFSNQDADALSAGKYIDLGSVEIH